MKKLNFGQAITALKEGKMLQREAWNSKELFVFMQIPSTIDANAVLKMQSLPDSVKDEFNKRFKYNPAVPFIFYKNQFAIVHPDNTIMGWSPSVSDTLANDWIILN